MRLPTLSLSRLELPAPGLDQVLRIPGRRSRVLGRRLLTLVGALEDAPETDPSAALATLTRRLEHADADEVWLTTAVLTAALPEEPDVVRGLRLIRMEGPAAYLETLLAGGLASLVAGPGPEVEVVTGEVLVDLQHTSRTELATGIQRVARMTARRWARDHDVVLVGWTDDHRALRRLRPQEAARALTGSTEGVAAGPDGAADTVVVPWRATYLLPELALERDRTHRMLALARHARSRTGVIGYDCVPVSTAETTDVGVSEGFSNFLAAVRHFSVVATDSRAAAGEFLGWRQMLTAIGVEGPRVEPVPLPVEAHEPGAQSTAEAHDRLLVGRLPLVLSVGTHEPRKNHLAVLHAAEVLWNRGVRFSLAFIGGHSWNSQRFDEGVARLRAAGHPVETLTTVTDDLLWAAYRVSHCLVFPSLNEGFGLPVAESLACGTPVVTSAFGSMAEIAADGGAVLVDPRDDASLVEGLARVLTDPQAYAELRAAAAARPQRTWDQYARETWTLLTGGGAA